MDVLVRRAQRSDLTAVNQLTSAAGHPLPDLERASRKRYRNIVADLGADLYLATRRDRPVGLVHLSYARDLFVGNRAAILALYGNSNDDLDALLDKAVERATRRQCYDISVAPGAWIPQKDELAARPGWDSSGTSLRFDVHSASRQSGRPAGS